MEQYVYLIRPTRDSFVDSMTEQEGKVMDRHFDYLNEMLSEGNLIMAGPCLDGAFGIVVFRAESEDMAKKVMESDPSVMERVMTGEVHPYRVSLMEKESQ
ncbi:YciI family protein [Pontibacillus yanchengensis]|uniref:YCII-related domain-containing protein n=1 Tax=Pontibacillus yanchengensis Y32 TaxID=1385514 RepID=A0A0A2TS65_9BACI|nr:YciI family protein [Pontibacillus yanchengensis]KGP72110.1 hypothetical protein N782_13815 [Pontibacillus yanchengensis Y32]